MDLKNRHATLRTRHSAALLSLIPLLFAAPMFDGGDSIELSYDSMEDVPEAFASLYTEKDGKAVLTGVKGMKSSGDVTRLTSALEKERKDHKTTKDKLAKYGDLDADEVHAKLDRFDELEAAADGKIDDTKINELVEKRLKQKTAPLEREIAQLKTQNTELGGTVETFKKKDKDRSISDHVRTAGNKLKVRDTAMEDAIGAAERVFEVNDEGEVLTRDGVGVTPGLTAEQWLTEMQSKRPHWWPESVGAGSKGGKGGGGGANNPWSAAGWNMTAQGSYLRENGKEKAEQMAKLAGTTVGGQRPAAKT